MAAKLIDPIENDLDFILDNKAVDLTHIDYNLSVGLPSQAILKYNVCYIVCAVLINDCNEVLLIQEAKPSCRGSWYLPAGRVDPDETLEEAVKREVREESGLVFEPHRIMCVETQAGSWFRFTFTGTISGGNLKTLDEADEESLQAQWLSLQSFAPGGSTRLRHRDIVGLIDMAVNQKSTLTHRPQLLPIINAHKKVLVRAIILHQAENRSLHVLFGTERAPHLPVCAIQPGDKAVYPHHLMQEIFVDPAYQKPEVKGVLTVEHCGKPHKENDGLCLTCVFTSPNNDPNLPKICGKFSWQSITRADLMERLCQATDHGRTAQLLHL